MVFTLKLWPGAGGNPCLLWSLWPNAGRR